MEMAVLGKAWCRKTEAKILKEYVGRNMSVLDDNIKIGIKETIFVFRLISSIQHGQGEILETFMKLLL